MEGAIVEGLTFDDVLLLPGKSSVLPAEADTRTCLTRGIALNIPMVSAAMDTVTEAHLAIAMARQGGLGFVHRNMSIEHQTEEIDRVKRPESGMIVDPVTISPEHSVRHALDLMNKYHDSGLPVTRGDRRDGRLPGPRGGTGARQCGLAGARYGARPFDASDRGDSCGESAPAEYATGGGKCGHL